jgi:hypothetical protein
MLDQVLSLYCHLYQLLPWLPVFKPLDERLEHAAMAEHAEWHYAVEEPAEKRAKAYINALVVEIWS